MVYFLPDVPETPYRPLRFRQRVMLLRVPAYFAGSLYTNSKHHLHPALGSTPSPYASSTPARPTSPTSKSAIGLYHARSIPYLARMGRCLLWHSSPLGIRLSLDHQALLHASNLLVFTEIAAPNQLNTWHLPELSRPKWMTMSAPTV